MLANFISSILTIFTILFYITVVDSAGQFEIVLSARYNNTSPLKLCRQQKVLQPNTECRTQVKFCLLEHQVILSHPVRCSFGNASRYLVVADGQDPQNQQNRLVDTTLILPFNFTWTKTFTAVITVTQQTNPASPVITLERLVISGHVLPGSPWKQSYNHGNVITIYYRIRVICKSNYYGLTCTKFCRRRDDRFGHYRCDRAGVKICDTGWKGPECDKPICKHGCSRLHGSCAIPGECRCAYGWEGSDCSTCTPHPHCVHGICVSEPWSCTCLKHWGGLLCDQDLNPCRMLPCHNGGLCSIPKPNVYACTCPVNYSGRNCETVNVEGVTRSIYDCRVGISTRRNGDTWMTDDCTQCQCVESVVNCHRVACSCIDKFNHTTCAPSERCAPVNVSHCITPPCSATHKCVNEKALGRTDLCEIGGCVRAVMTLDTSKLPIGVTVEMVCDAVLHMGSLTNHSMVTLSCDRESTTDHIATIHLTLELLSKQDQMVGVARQLFKKVAKCRNHTIFSAVLNIDVVYQGPSTPNQNDKVHWLLVACSVLSIIGVVVIILFAAWRCLNMTRADRDILRQNAYNKKLQNVRRFSNPTFDSNQPNHPHDAEHITDTDTTAVLTSSRCTETDGVIDSLTGYRYTQSGDVVDADSMQQSLTCYRYTKSGDVTDADSMQHSLTGYKYTKSGDVIDTSSVQDSLTGYKYTKSGDVKDADSMQHSLTGYKYTQSDDVTDADSMQHSLTGSRYAKTDDVIDSLIGYRYSQSDDIIDTASVENSQTDPYDMNSLRTEESFINGSLKTQNSFISELQKDDSLYDIKDLPESSHTGLFSNTEECFTHLPFVDEDEDYNYLLSSEHYV